MTVGSLFSGIGGLDLGLERAGHRVLWQVESNAFCRRILAQHWPDVPCYSDVKKLTGTNLEPVDLLCGGFPCQPVSQAGQRKGTDDDRWLWPHFARLLGVLRPSYALLENVPGLLTANGGHAFGAILADLADCGYDAEWDCLPAAAVGAPHLRYRIFLLAVLADADRPGRQEQRGAEPVGPQFRSAERGGETLADADRGVRDGGTDQPGRGSKRRVTADGGGETLADADHQRCVGGRQPEQRGEQGPRWREPDGSLSDGRFFDAQIGGQWTVEPSVGRVAHGVSQRVDRLKALGNAVVPQVAEWIGRRLNDAS